MTLKPHRKKLGRFAGFFRRIRRVNCRNSNMYTFYGLQEIELQERVLKSWEN